MPAGCKLGPLSKDLSIGIGVVGMLRFIGPERSGGRRAGAGCGKLEDTTDGDNSGPWFNTSGLNSISADLNQRSRFDKVNNILETIIA